MVPIDMVALLGQVGDFIVRIGRFAMVMRRRVAVLMLSDAVTGNCGFQ
jgi:hypothetical protein